MSRRPPKIELPKPFAPLFQPQRYKVFWGGRGGGRSWAAARAIAIMGAAKPLRFLCAREYQKSIQDSVHRLLVDQIEALGLADRYEVQRAAIKGQNGTLMLFEGLAQNVTKIKSLEGIDICWVEEAEKVTKNSWDVLIPTIRKDGSEIWVTFNPDLETDPTYQMFVKNSPPDAAVVHTTWRDNPWFPAVLEKEKDYLWSVDPERARWVWDGECRSHTDAQVLQGKWRVAAFEPAEGWNGPYFGADWGFAKDPTTLIRFWLDPHGSLYVEYEAYGVGVDLDFTPGLFDTVPDSRKHKISADNARPETISHMNRHGFNMESAQKGKGSVEEGVVWLRSRPEIVIHPRCKHTIDEAKFWCWKTDRLTGDIKPDLVDAWNHCWDAIRYGAHRIIHRKIAIVAPPPEQAAAGLMRSQRSFRPAVGRQ